jgi:hypothetical protein
VLAERLDGKPIELDPGSYTLRFEARGSPPVSVDVVAQAGVKNRVVEATFPVTDAKPEGASPPLPFWILAGVGTVAVGSFATFAILGQEQYSDLEERCAPGCDPADSDSVRTKFLIADVSMVVAALAYGGAASFYFAVPAKRVDSPSPSRRVAPTRAVARPRFAHFETWSIGVSPDGCSRPLRRRNRAPWSRQVTSCILFDVQIFVLASAQPANSITWWCRC